MGQIDFQNDGKVPRWLFSWVVKHINKVEIKQDDKYAIWTTPNNPSAGGTK